MSAATKSECRGKLDELREEKRKTGTVARRDVTVGQVLDDWLANPPPDARSVKTHRCHENAAARLPEALKRTALIRLTPGQVENARGAGTRWPRHRHDQADAVGAGACDPPGAA